jgi:DNA-binding GntR family transcriptional regulator
MYVVKRPESLCTQAIAQIRRAIVLGQLAPGSMHSEQSLAADLSISRTPTREALLHLADEALVKFLPQRGVRVANIDAQKLGDVFEARTAIEGHCAFLLAKRPRKEALAALEVTLRRQQDIIEANDHVRWVEANMEFHTALVGGVRNEEMDKTMVGLASHSMRVGYRMIASQERMRELLTQHRAILEAIRAGDRDRARLLVGDHLDVCLLSIDQMISGSQVEEPGPRPKGRGR